MTSQEKIILFKQEQRRCKKLAAEYQSKAAALGKAIKAEQRALSKAG